MIDAFPQQMRFQLAIIALVLFVISAIVAVCLDLIRSTTGHRIHKRIVTTTYNVTLVWCFISAILVASCLLY